MGCCFENFMLTEVIKNAKGKTLSVENFMQVDSAAEPIIDYFLQKYGRDSFEYFENLDKTIKLEEIWPWAIILFKEEFRLAGHVVSLRKDRKDFLFSAYSIGPGPYSIAAQGVPPVSVLLMNNKTVLEEAAKQSPLFDAAWSQLADKSEDQHWVCITDSPPADWVAVNSQNDDQLFRSVTGL